MFLFGLSVCLLVCLYPINFKTAILIKPHFVGKVFRKCCENRWTKSGKSFVDVIIFECMRKIGKEKLKPSKKDFFYITNLVKI